MHRGFIKIWRKIEDWEWVDDPNTLALLFHCTMLANWKDKKWHGTTIERGSFITSLSNLAAQTGLTVQQTRTSLNKLISTNCVTKKTTNNYTHISVNNYNLYQDHNKQDNKRITNEQQTNNKRITTTKEYKNVKNITTYGVSGGGSLPKSELQREYIFLLEKFNSLYRTRFKSLEPLGNYIKWRASYTSEEILEAIGRLNDHPWLNDKKKLELVFRTSDTHGNPSDRIGELLSLRTRRLM